MLFGTDLTMPSCNLPRHESDLHGFLQSCLGVFTHFFKKDLLQKGQLEQEAPVSIGLSARSAYLKRHDVQGPDVLLHVEANDSFAGRICCIASTET